jgi:hypothetical protein
MRRIAFLALGATALCAVAFSPGPEVALALIIVVLTVALGVIAVPWLKTLLTFTSRSIDVLTGHGHVHLQADGLGVGGRHGLPRTIVVLMLAVWALILSAASRAGHAVANLLIPTGHVMARTNTSAQPLPS